MPPKRPTLKKKVQKRKKPKSFQDTIMTIEAGILIICLTVLLLVVFLIPTVIQLRRSAKEIEKVTGHLNQQLPEILENVNNITSNLNSILSSGRQQAARLGEATNNIKLMVDDIVGFEKKVKTQIEHPLLETLITLTAITKAIRTFLVIFLNRK
jgi:uncharacterized protein YoxC